MAGAPRRVPERLGQVCILDAPASFAFLWRGLQPMLLGGLWTVTLIRRLDRVHQLSGCTGPAEGR